MNQELTTEELAERFVFLDGLRESGLTNMLGARPFVMEHFFDEGKLAGEVLSAWMATFSHETPAFERARSALADG